MIGSAMALIAVTLLFTIPKTVAKVILALGVLVPSTSCLAACVGWTSVFFEASILGMFSYMLQYSFNLSSVQAFVVNAILSFTVSLILLKGFEKERVNEWAEIVASAIILAIVGLSYAFPQASSQVFFALAQSLWLVDGSAANAFLFVAVAIAVVTILFEYNLFSFMFDPEFFEYKSGKMFWPWLTLFLLHLGVSSATLTIGLFATITVLSVPGILALKFKLRELEEMPWILFSLTIYALWIGTLLSENFNVSELGVAGAIFIILIVLPDLWVWKDFHRLRSLGVKLAKAGKGYRGQEGETGGLEEGKGDSSRKEEGAGGHSFDASERRRNK